MVTVSDYLFRKASIHKIPLNGVFELSPVCNFSCKMCYVRRTQEQIRQERKRLKTWEEWLELGRKCRDEGTLFLLLTGGEPFLYPHFRELYIELKNLGLVISINSNGTMIDEETVEWLKCMPPSRINITLYGASRETYAKVCQNPDGYDKTVKAIKLLKEAGIPVVINASMIPENADDMEQIVAFAKENQLNARISTYMFPPIRREEEDSDSRFTAKESAKMCMNKYVCQLPPEEVSQYVDKQLETLQPSENDGEETWGSHREEFMKCRAGRSSFWVSWEGEMTACGMLPFPISVYPFEDNFHDCWMQLTNKVRSTEVLKECQGCPKKEICNPCVAMIYSETGSVNKKASYLCDLTDCMIEEMQQYQYKILSK